MVDGGSAYCCRRVPHENRHIDIVNYVNRDLPWDRSSHRDIDVNLDCVLYDTGHSNRNSHGHLHLHGTLNLLSNHDIIRTWNRNRNRAWNANS
jgi:predicted metal-dependent RNase